MSKRNSLSDFPEQCYVVINGNLRIITRGETGSKRAPINAENSAANRELASLKNRELGVKPEEVKLMFTGSIMGWDAWIAPKKALAASLEIFRIELCRENKAGLGATLKLPATPFEIADALDKVRITDTATPYHSELENCKLDYLPQFILPNANLYELNHLAQRLSSMTNWELDCFEGMVMMDTIKKDYAPIPIERLINMTHSIDNCQIAYEASDDKSLGKFYVDNDFPVIPDNLPEVLYELLDYEAIGRKARTGEGGVFTEKGYVVHSGEMSQAYQAGSAMPPEKPSYTIELEVCKGFFEDKSHTESPLLPADDGMINRVLAQLEAASEEECSFKAVDCIVPALTELISDELYASEGDCYGTVNELATQLKKLDTEGRLTTYRAMIEAAPEDLSLVEALDLSYQAVDFSLMREMTAPPDYAKAELAKCSIPLQDELIASTDLWYYGGKLMAQNLAITTGYGILCALDGMTVEQCLGRAEPSQGMEMR